MSPVTSVGGTTRNIISTLTRIELLGTVVWYRNKAKIKTAFGRSYLKKSSLCSYVRELPRELIDKIIAHILLDTQTLKAFSATCRSWYIAALPYLHHTLTLRPWARDPAYRGLRPLQKLGKVQLLPLVKRLRITRDYMSSESSLPTVLNARSPVYFAFMNVQELAIDKLNLPALTPRVHLYIGPFMPTLRSLTLRKPLGTYTQLLYFLGLFPNLDNLELIDGLPGGWASAPELVPRSAPSLRGRLTLKRFRDLGFPEGLSGLSGGLRFRYMDIFGVGPSARLLLESCAETLETLRVYWDGDQNGWSENLVQGSDLSKNRSLRSLEIIGQNIWGEYHVPALRPFRNLLSTITSPRFSEVVIVLQDGAIRNGYSFEHLLNVVRGTYEVKPFCLVFCLEIWEGYREDATKMLRSHINAEAARGLLDFLPCPPIIVYNTHATHSSEWQGLRI